MGVCELSGLIETRRRELAALFQQRRDEDGRLTLSEEECVEVRRRNEELSTLSDRLEAAREAEEIERRNREALERDQERRRPPLPGPFRGEQGAGPISLGRLFLESRAYRGYQGGQGPVDVLDVDLKTLMSTTAGWDPEDLRTDRITLSAQQGIRVIDVIPKSETTMSTVLYMEETTFTNNAAEAAEAAAYGESALAYTERSSEVRKIAVSLPVTDEMLEDAPRLRDLIDNRLRFMLAKRLDSQILVGSGVAPNLTGVNNIAGINTQAKGADPVYDAIHKGMVLCQTVGFADPTAILMHPQDWQDLRLTRTADGVYLLGSPGDHVEPRLFGLPVVVTTHQTQNTAVVGDFRMHSELVMRRGIEVRITDAHSTFFTEGKQMLRADLRVALVFDRAAAFCKVTGI